jgi:hypothetical protein
MAICKICGQNECKEHVFKIKGLWKKSITGSSPPEIFVGRWNYPNVYAGILAPEEQGDTSRKSSPEYWHTNRLSLQEIRDLRKTLVYGKTLQHIKSNVSKPTRIMQEIAMTRKSIATELTFKKPLQVHDEQHPTTAYIANAALLDSAKLQENAPVEKKVDYLVNDTSVKATDALSELNKAHIPVEMLVKLLSAGLLGRKTARTLVPTRWSITAVDDTLSKQALKKIKLYPALSEFQLFNAEYVGNHYEFLIIPDTFSFEVIEHSMSYDGTSHDHETIIPRKTYADSVTGAYYANRLALTEYLERIKRQATCIVFREVRPEYTLPCGVGVLRELSREAFSKQPERPKNIEEALKIMQSRLRTDIRKLTEASVLLKNINKQRKLTQFFN